MKDLIAYGDDKSNPDIYNSVFQPATWKTIIHLFPRENVNRMIQFNGSTKDVLNCFYNYVIELRDSAKRAIQADPFGDSFGDSEPSNGGGYAVNYCVSCLEINRLDQCACSDEDRDHY